MGLTSYRDIDTNLVARADNAVKARFTPLPVYRIGDVLSASDGPLPFVEDAYKITRATELRWLVATLKPGMDARAKRSLTERGLSVFAPEEQVWVEVHRQKVLRVRPLFPRYLFCGLPVLDRHGNVDSFVLRRCDGVADVVRCAGAPVAIDEGVIGDLMWANERRWLGFIQATAAQRPTREMRAAGFVDDMRRILEADPTQRMAMFVEKFRYQPKARQAKVA